MILVELEEKTSLVKEANKIKKGKQEKFEKEK